MTRRVVTVEQAAAGLDVELIGQIVAAYDRVAGNTSSPGLARWCREMAAALVEHLAEREADPMWDYRFPLIDLPPVD